MEEIVTKKTAIADAISGEIVRNSIIDGLDTINDVAENIYFSEVISRFLSIKNEMDSLKDWPLGNGYYQFSSLSDAIQRGAKFILPTIGVGTYVTSSIITLDENSPSKLINVGLPNNSYYSNGFDYSTPPVVVVSLAEYRKDPIALAVQEVTTSSFNVRLMGCPQAYQYGSYTIAAGVPLFTWVSVGV